MESWPPFLEYLTGDLQLPIPVSTSSWKVLKALSCLPHWERHLLKAGKAEGGGGPVYPATAEKRIYF